ncbi:MAG: uroporphyrinogen-III decarboxylase-like protein [Pirellulaceae bacterium]|nr:uroporphyrinogen-III decarboxylase-like protein [Pirellulaceae bacterium]
MTPRERWMALLEGKTPDRIPTDYQATEEVTARLRRDLQCADDEALYRKLYIDARRFVEPKWNRPDDLNPEADMWGIVYRSVSYGEGAYLEPVEHPLAGAETPADVAAHRWPSCDEFDYSVVARAVEADDGFRPIHAGCYEPLLLYGYLRGLQTTMEDLALRPEIADAVLGRIFDFHEEHHRRIFEAGCRKFDGKGDRKGARPHLPERPEGCFAQMGPAPFSRIDTTWVAEDLGSQTGPLLSLAMYRRFLLPNQIKMADLARSFGVHVMYHTDGAARVFLPDLIDRVGIEILNPIQWRCPGMEREGLAADFGNKIIFHGSIDNQQTLPFGTVEDVAREVRESVEIYRGARWICGPCHNLQPVSPPENIVALYQTIREIGGG